MDKDIVVTGVGVLEARQGRIIIPESCEQDGEGVDTGPHVLNRVQKIVLAAFLKARRAAGLERWAIASDRTAIFMGNSYGIDGFKADFFRLYKKSAPLLTSPSLFPFTTSNSLSAWLAIATGARGVNTTFVSGCQSSSQALLAARDALTAGECDLAVVGGVSLLYEDLSEEFAASGFRKEVVAIVILETCGHARMAGRKIEGRLVHFSYGRVDLGQKKSFHKRDKVSFFGNNLGETVFSYDAGNLDGNVFDAAGVLGIVRARHLETTSIRCSSIDSSKTVFSFVLEKI